MMRRSGVLALLLAVTGCGAGRNDYGADAGWGRPGTDSGNGAVQDAQAPPPPEVEERRNFQTPQAGGRFVFVANPARDTVAVVDSTTLAVESVEVGRRPTYLQTLTGRDEAIVLNTGSQTASVVRMTSTGAQVSHLPIFPGANAIAVAPDGRHAVVYIDTDAPGATVSGSFQDIAVLTLEAGRDRVVQTTVGFRPLDVVFSSDGTTAFVVTEDGVSIVRFAEVTGPTIIPNISLADPMVATADAGMLPARDASVDATVDVVDSEDASSEGGMTARPDAMADVVRPPESPMDVSITRDGQWALARSEGSPRIRIVDLRTRMLRTLDVGGAVTDLDVSPDGTFALAVLREQSQVVRIPLPGGFDDPTMARVTTHPGEFFGSVTVAPDGRRAILYTTTQLSRRLLVMDLAGSEGTYALPLRKYVRAVAYAPDSRTALVVHQRTAGSPEEPNIDLQTRLDRSYGYSLVEPAVRFIKLQVTPADVGPFAIVPGGTHAFLLVRDDAQHIAQADRVSLRSFVVEPLALGSPPFAVGSIPTTRRVFIGQVHPEGRLTFVDWENGSLQSVTGFELNSRIVQ